MNRAEYLKWRNELYFGGVSAAQFVPAVERMLQGFASAGGNKDELAQTAAEIAVDAVSYIPEWQFTKQNPNARQALNEGYTAILQWLADAGHLDKVSWVKQEALHLANSNLLRAAYMADKGLLNTRCGNDQAWDLISCMRTGAMVATTNPIMIDLIRKHQPEIWDPVRDELMKKHPGATKEEMVTRLTIEVIKRNCEELLPVFRATNGEMGYVNMQVNPYHMEDSEKMAAEAEFVYNELKAYLGETPNVMFKIPAVKAGIRAVEILVQKGISVLATAACSYAQHMAFAEAIEGGASKINYVVIMSGRLDGPVIEELQAQGVENAEEIGHYASVAVFQKSYREYLKRGYKNSRLMSAAIRVPLNVEEAFTDKASPTIMSVSLAQAAVYDSVPRTVAPNVQIPGEVMEILLQSKVFREGYEDDGLTLDTFAGFNPVAFISGQFRDCYDAVVEYLS